MNRSKLLLTVLFAIAFLGFIPTAHAQIAEGIGLSQDPLPSSSRGVAMGGSLISDATGVDALQANPAALAPLAERDVEIGLLNRDHGSTATFFGNASAASLDATSLGSLGIAAPFAVTQGHFAIGVSYDRARDYTTTYSFKAVNPSSSSQTWRTLTAECGGHLASTRSADALSTMTSSHSLTGND